MDDVSEWSDMFSCRLVSPLKTIKIQQSGGFFPGTEWVCHLVEMKLVLPIIYLENCSHGI